MLLKDSPAEESGSIPQLPAANHDLGSPPAIVEAVGVRTEYDPLLADETVRFPRPLFDRRFWKIGFALLNFVFASSIQALFPNKKLSLTQQKREKAATLRDLLFELGPTFIKLGQFLSVRRDILSEELAEELTLLQDRVPPFGLDLVRQTIESDLGGTPEDLFTQFDATPIASASIGQVHRVRLKDGKWAVIKVQRPNLAQQFNRDLGLMRLMAKMWIYLTSLAHKLGLKPPMPKASPNTKDPAQISRHRPLDVQAWIDLSDEFGRTLFSEIDYLKEGRNADRLRRAVRSKPHIRVPRVIWKYTGRHVLALEYIPGTKISQTNDLRAQGFDLEQVGNMLVNCYLEQFVITGFFHADPHAGNLAIDDYGRLIIYDFGMMGEITEDNRRALLQCVMAVVRRDTDRVTKCLMELGIVSKTAPADAVSRSLSPFIDYYAGRDIMDLDFDHLEKDIDEVIADRSFRLPANLAYLLRAGSSLEGIARTLKPDFSFVAAVRPVMLKWALHQGIESLARSGKLREFAEFAFDELRASLKSDGDGDSKRLLKRFRPGATVSSAQGTPSKTIPTAKITEAIVLTTAAPAKCPECSQHAHDVRKLNTQIRTAFVLILVWVVLSVGSVILMVFADSSSYGPLTLYFVIGNGVLGAIIIWKFTYLLKWTSQHSPKIDSRGNGE